MRSRRQVSGSLSFEILQSTSLGFTDCKYASSKWHPMTLLVHSEQHAMYKVY